MAEWEWYRGEYATWEEARRSATGWEDPAILGRVVAATRSVRAGRAAFERDGVEFPELRLNFQLLAALFQAAATRGNRLNVLDYGGSLGSAFWQHRAALSSLDSLSWRVVEQPHYVEAGRAEFETDQLSFWHSLSEADRSHDADLLLASGVLQYFENPWSTVRDILSLEVPFLLFDRLPLLDESSDRLTVEHAPPEIGLASYPLWFLSHARLLEDATERYELLYDYATLLPEGLFETCWAFGKLVPNRGLFFRRRDDLRQRGRRPRLFETLRAASDLLRHRRREAADTKLPGH